MNKLTFCGDFLVPLIKRDRDLIEDTFSFTLYLYIPLYLEKFTFKCNSSRKTIAKF